MNMKRMKSLTRGLSVEVLDSERDQSVSMEHLEVSRMTTQSLQNGLLALEKTTGVDLNKNRKFSRQLLSKHNKN